MEKKNRKGLYKHDYSGSCSPGSIANHISQHTFSVGIFQWIPRASLSGLKKSAVKYRIRGNVSNPQEVYDKAEKKCDEFDKRWVQLKQGE